MSYKIYVHHKYSYERFWYFFHGVDVNINDIITYTNQETAFNKFSTINDNVNILAKYKEVELDITFVGKSNWESHGHHIIDYSIDLYDRNLVSDRGYNSNIRKIVGTEYIPLLNSKCLYKNTKYHFFYIDWEGHNPYYEHNMDSKLNRNVNLYVDELYRAKYDGNIKNKFFVFTNTFMSFIYPNTLGLKEYYHFSDILKYKNDYKYRLNYPLRRLYGNKIRLYNKIMELDNRKINVTHSSFHDTRHYSEFNQNYRESLIDKIGNENFIQKRGYGIDDWGGEWNDNNLNEFMWKMFGISEVNIIPEYNPYESYIYGDYTTDKKMIGYSFMTEKSVSHILANKPFIPLSYVTIEFYNNILKEYGFDFVEFPLKYEILTDVIVELNDIANDDEEWSKFLIKLKTWLSTTRECILKIINTNNSFLDNMLSQKSELITTSNLL